MYHGASPTCRSVFTTFRYTPCPSRTEHLPGFQSFRDKPVIGRAASHLETEINVLRVFS